MPQVALKHLKKQSQNGSSLPKSNSHLEARSEQELKAIANESHAAYGACLRSAVNHARLAGQALIEMRARLKHGEWGAWLKQHFKGSAESARVYMNIARNWAQIVKQGLDKKEDVTLAQLRTLLAKPSNCQSAQKKATEPVLDIGQDEPNDAPPPPQKRQIPAMSLDADDADEFDHMVGYLMPVLDTDTVPDTVLEAVRFCYKANCSGQ